MAVRHGILGNDSRATSWPAMSAANRSKAACPSMSLRRRRTARHPPRDRRNHARRRIAQHRECGRRSRLQGNGRAGCHSESAQHRRKKSRHPVALQQYPRLQCQRVEIHSGFNYRKRPRRRQCPRRRQGVVEDVVIQSMRFLLKTHIQAFCISMRNARATFQKSKGDGNLG